MRRLLAPWVLLLPIGCGQASPSKLDYSQKPTPGNETPYVPKNHRNVAEKANKGPSQPLPRVKKVGE